MIRAIRSLLPNKEENIYIALSMGVDSVAASHWMLSKGYSNLTMLHFNHNLREQNNEMEKSFYKFCKDFNLKNICGSGQNLKLEKECREARLNFYEKHIKNGRVVTAHHLNDCVESYLLNCLRGNPNHKIFNLNSIFVNYEIIHPFLTTKKKDFIQYAERNNLEKYIVSDDTNKKIKGSRRNWVRGVLIPEMEKQKISLEKYVLGRIKKEVDKTEKHIRINVCNRE